MNNASPKRMHYPALDGLRGIAILLVILYHNFGFIHVFNYGWLGVDLFFVLSGFLITELLLGSRDTRNYFKNFYIRRMLRIFPLYYLTLIVIILILPAIKSFPFNFDFYINNQLWFWFYLENWLLILKQWGYSHFVLNHFWSLAVEEQFYLIWPFIILFIRKPKHLLWLCFSLLLLVISARYYVWHNRVSYPVYLNIFLFTRIDGILIGAMLALVKLINYNFLNRYSYIVVSGLAAINFIFYFINRNGHFIFPYWGIVGYTTFAIMFALLTHEAINKNGRILNFILNITVLKFLGKVSYGFYVFHWPVYLLLYKYVETWIISTFELTGFNLHIAVSLFLTVISFLLSVASYYTYERMWMKLKDRFKS